MSAILDASLPVQSNLESANSQVQHVGPTTGPAAGMKSASAKRISQLDFIRGIAILLVIGYHATTVPTTVTAFRVFDSAIKRIGWSGVDLFFVLSGFLVGGLLVGEYSTQGSIRIGRFIKRRGFKIWPAYYFYLCFQVVTGHFPISTFLLPNLLHLQNYLGTSLSHTWSLAVEEHFYLLLPFLLVFLVRSPTLRKHILAVLLTLCVLTLVVRSCTVIFLGSTSVWEYTHTRIDSLLFGVLLSYLYHCRRTVFDDLLQRKTTLVGFVFAGLLFLFSVADTSTTMHTVGYTIVYLSYASLMLLTMAATGAWTRGAVYRLVSWIGLYSYSIYLWHNSVRSPLLKLSSFLPSGLQWPLLFISQFVCAIILGVLMAKLIERPFLRLRERFAPLQTQQLKDPGSPTVPQLGQIVSLQ